MPGHPIGESMMEETISNIRIITEAIAAHDVIFLLLDTREARWLPTLLAAHYGKVYYSITLLNFFYINECLYVSPACVPEPLILS